MRTVSCRGVRPGPVGVQLAVEAIYTGFEAMLRPALYSCGAGTTAPPARAVTVYPLMHEPLMRRPPQPGPGSRFQPSSLHSLFPQVKGPESYTDQRYRLAVACGMRLRAGITVSGVAPELPLAGSPERAPSTRRQHPCAQLGSGTAAQNQANRAPYPPFRLQRPIAVRSGLEFPSAGSTTVWRSGKSYG